MKRIWVAVCAMVLMITLCVIELSFTNSSIDRLTEKLDQAEQKVHDQDYSTAFRLSEEALEVWNSDHKVLSFYTTSAPFTARKLRRLSRGKIQSRRPAGKREG